MRCSSAPAPTCRRIAQVQLGLNAWARAAGGAGVGAAVGPSSARSPSATGCKGSYFALVTLAFAEVFRILAHTVPSPARGVGLMVPLRESVGEHPVRRRARAICRLVLALVVAALLVTGWLRHSRFGAWLQAVRDNEDAARAIGVDPFRVKLRRDRAVGRPHGRGRRVLRAGVPVHRPGIAYGPAVSVEALVASDRRRHGHAVGAGAGRGWCCTCSPTSRAACSATLPGINMVIYGVGADPDRHVPAARRRRRGRAAARRRLAAGRPR